MNICMFFSLLPVKKCVTKYENVNTTELYSCHLTCNSGSYNYRGRIILMAKIVIAISCSLRFSSTNYEAALVLFRDYNSRGAVHPIREIELT